MQRAVRWMKVKFNNVKLNNNEWPCRIARGIDKHLEHKSRKIVIPITSVAVYKSFSNFVHRTAALPYSVQMSQRLGNSDISYEQTGVDVIHGLRWVSDGYPILHSLSGFIFVYMSEILCILILIESNVVNSIYSFIMVRAYRVYLLQGTAVSHHSSKKWFIA